MLYGPCTCVLSYPIPPTPRIPYISPKVAPNPYLFASKSIPPRGSNASSLSRSQPNGRPFALSLCL
jgi:hypothetical protein